MKRYKNGIYIHVRNQILYSRMGTLGGACCSADAQIHQTARRRKQTAFTPWPRFNKKVQVGVTILFNRNPNPRLDPGCQGTVSGTVSEQNEAEMRSLCAAIEPSSKRYDSTWLAL